MKLRLIVYTLTASCVLFFGTLFARATVDLPPPADLIIHNAKVITVNPDFAMAQAMAVSGDRIVAVGKEKAVMRFKGPGTRVIDAQGKTVLPGLEDSDVSSYEAAATESNAAPIFNSLADAFAYIKAQAAQKPPGTWIVVERAYPTRLKEGRFPTKAELDAAAPKHPVFWDCGMVTMVNSKALEISKLTANTRVPPSVEIVLDASTRKPTGLIYNGASLLKLPASRAPVAQERGEALKRLYALYNAQGITSIAENDAGPEAINLFRDLSQSGELTVRINCERFLEPGTNLEQTLARLDALTNTPAGKVPYGPTGAGDDWVRIGPLNTRVDGDLLTGTALLRTPWGIGATYQITDPAYRGRISQDPAHLTAVLLRAAQHGWQLSADCTGNAAVDQLLNCFQHMQFKMDIRQRRFVINHASFLANESWDVCKEFGIAASVQPTWLYYDGASLMRTLGDNRLRNFMPLKTWFDNGLTVGAGSAHLEGFDSAGSANPWNPWLGMWISLSRETDQGAAIHSEQQLTRAQAIQLYTINNATLHFDERNKGSLEVGKFADLIMIDRDILKCPVTDVRNTKTLLTMVGGKIVWEAK